MNRMQTRNDKNVHYAEDNKQTFDIICMGKIDEGTKPFSFSKRYGILVCMPQSSYGYGFGLASNVQALALRVALTIFWKDNKLITVIIIN